jgi:3-dehydroquinate dehydratase
MNNRVEVLHGVNFDVLGRRDAAHYGGLTLTRITRANSGST